MRPERERDLLLVEREREEPFNLYTWQSDVEGRGIAGVIRATAKTGSFSVRGMHTR